MVNYANGICKCNNKVHRITLNLQAENMEIKKATFKGSWERSDQMPDTRIPEFAFIGRSNVGKSSLINMLCNHKGLAKTSAQPGKTQT